MRKPRMIFLVVGALLAAGAGWTQQNDASKAGWISDEACGAEHTKPGRADCVEKCWRGGASVGHPEWKAQRAVFVADDDRAIWIVENSEAVKKFPAAHVVLSGTFDSATKSVHVNSANASADDDAKIVAALDTEYQAAVKKNDAAGMDRILADDFILVIGSGKVFTKADLLEEALSGRMHYEHQEDSAQTVRVWGDTAVVTAKLWEKDTENGKAFDYTLWFSDTYVRTATGWRYVFGQASLPLPKTP